jgi:hypothetical protein
MTQFNVEAAFHKLPDRQGGDGREIESKRVCAAKRFPTYQGNWAFLLNKKTAGRFCGRCRF